MATKETSWLLRLVDKISGPMSKIAEKTDVATRKAMQLTQQYDRLAERSSKLTGRLGKMAIAGAAFGALAYGSLQFEQSMAKANTMANVGTQQLKAYTDQVRELSEIAPVAKTELAEGLYQTISNGVPEKNWMQFLTDSTKAAVGGQAELGGVVSVTATIIKNYGKEWSEALDIQDKIQMTAKLGKTSFEELGAALPKVSGSAAILGVTINEMMGSFSALTGVSGNTGEVSTQLGGIFRALVKPTSEATKMAEQMGMAFNASSIKDAGGLGNFLDQFKAKAEQFAKANNIDVTTVYGQFFDSEALRGLIPLLTSVNADFKSKTLEIANSAGTVDAAFKNMSETGLAQLQIMRNKFSNIIDKIVEALGPLFFIVGKVVSSILDLAQGFIKNFPVASRLSIIISGLAFGMIFFGTVISLGAIRMAMWWKQVQIAALTSSGFTGAIARMTLAMGGYLKALVMTSIGMLRWIGQMVIATTFGLAGFVSGMLGATAAQWGLNIAMTANPIGLIIVGIAALIGVVVLMIKYWDQVTDVFKRVWDFYMKYNVFSLIWKVLTLVFPALKKWGEDVFGGITDFFKEAWDWIGRIYNRFKTLLGLKGTMEISTIDKETKDKKKPELIDPDLLKSGLIDPTKTDNKDKSEAIQSRGVTSINQEINVTFNSEGQNLSIESIRNLIVQTVAGGAADGAAIALSR